MNVNILLQRLAQGEPLYSSEGDVISIRPASALALQATRAIKQLLEIIEGNDRVINQLRIDNGYLNEQIKHLQSNNSGEQTPQ